jgi:hypothetical protein
VAALLLALVGLSLWSAVTAHRDRQRLALLEQRLSEREEALAAVRRSLAEAERQLGARPAREARWVQELEARVAELTSELAATRRTALKPEGRPPQEVASAVGVAVAPRFVVRGRETPERSFLRGGGAVNSLRILAPEKGFTAAVDLGDHRGYAEYRLELIARDGKLLWTGRRRATALLGDDGTSIAVSGLGPGRYRLRIEGLNARGSDLVAEYLLEVVTASPR